MPTTPFVSLLLPATLTLLAYVGAGQLALLLAIPPGYAAPIYPAAGIALAATLVYGRRVLPGVLLGAFIVTASLGAPQGLARPGALLVALLIGAGAAAQAGLGAWLVRRRLRAPLGLAEPRDVLAFGWRGAAVACLVSATLATATLAAWGVIPAEARAFTWWTWWAGDTLGVLIGAPVALTLIGEPRADWAARRINVGLPLLVATLLLALATMRVARWDEQRNHSLFERDAAAAADAVDSRLQQSLYALEAMRGLFIGSDDVTADELRRAAAPWLQLPIGLQAIGYSERVVRTALPAFEAAASRADGSAYRVFERSEGGGASIAAADADVVAIRFIEPAAPNAAARGVNAMSVAAARAAIERTAASDAPAASAAFRLTQEPGQATGVVLYRALYGGTPQAGVRAATLRGVVFVTLRIEPTLAGALRDLPTYLDWCLVDQGGPEPARRLAGSAGCAAAPGGTLRYLRPIDFGGRHWQLRFEARAGAVPEAGHGNAWLFSSVGLLSVAMLAALLLTMTGRARRIEAAVTERTADLEREAQERAHTEGALRDSEQRLRNIIDHAPIGIVYADVEGRIREANPKLRAMLGYTDDEIIERGLADLIHPDDRAEGLHLLARLRRGEIAQVRRRERLQQRDGATIWVQMNLSVLRDALGQPQRLVAVVEDITEHLSLQEAERGRARAESASRAKSDFLSRISHELRTPLNAMLGFAQLLELDRDPALLAHQKEWTAQILHAGWHLLEMINDTLDLSRIESGTLRLETAPIDLAPLLRLCVAMIEPAAGRRGILVHEHVEPDARAVCADATRLKQVLTNLLSNAVKYNVDNGRVEVEVRRIDADTVEIAVSDTGPGLSAAQQDELFQPFNRLGREHGSIEGTGIGLVISHGLAELMGGSLRVRSTPGQGSTFMLSLPRATRVDSAPGEGADAGISAAALYHQRRVHYVEDNATNAEVMRGILAQRPQVQLEVSALGLDGLAAIRAHPPDLILLDMHLPDIDGLELLRHLKRDIDTAAIPVVAVSADATAARINEAIAAGALHYVTKPFSLALFLALIDTLLEAADTRFG